MSFDSPPDPSPICKECPQFNECKGPHDCLLDPDPDAYDEDQENDFVARRSRLEGQQEDAEESRAEFARADFEAQMERLREKRRGDERLSS
jgi:hypothetical protein